MKKKTSNGSKVVKLAVIGASLAGLAAGAYFFLGPKGKKHQRQAKAWAIKMKGDVVEKLELARNVSESAYHGIIDSVAAKYEKSRKASRGEIQALARDLKKHWRAISGSAKTVKHGAAKSKKRTVKKARRK